MRHRGPVFCVRTLNHRCKDRVTTPLTAHPPSKKVPPMPLGPRVVFMRFVDEESPKLTPWITHSSSVIGPALSALVAVAAKQGEGRSVWQLVSGNNRQLARGVGIHSTFESARAHAQSVIDSRAELTVEHVSEAGRGVYGWFATLAGVPVMTCARWYLTDRDRRHSSDIATRSLSTAILHAGSRLTDPTLMAGPRGAAV